MEDLLTFHERMCNNMISPNISPNISPLCSRKTSMQVFDDDKDGKNIEFELTEVEWANACFDS